MAANPCANPAPALPILALLLLVGLCVSLPSANCCQRQRMGPAESLGFRLGDRWLQAIKGQTLDSLNCLMRNVDGAVRTRLEGRIDYWLLEYYRHVRNHVVHGKSLKRVRALRRGLLRDENGRLSAFLGGRPEPNLPGELSYDDYKIYTRALSNFAQQINDGCDLAAKEMARGLLSDEEVLPRLRRLKGNEKRMRRYSRRTAVWKFNARPRHFDEIADVVTSKVMSEPTRRQRGLK